MKDQSLESGPQRTFDAHARGRHATDRRDSPHEMAAQSFAKDLADLLDDGRERKALDNVVLVAEPHFLGLLRAELAPKTSALVLANVPKDLHAVPPEQVSTHLAEVFAH